MSEERQYLVSKSEYLYKRKLDTYFYRCPKCRGFTLVQDIKFCPDCSSLIKWPKNGGLTDS